MQTESLINGKLLGSYLKRFWAMWLAFFCIWAVLFVMPLFGTLSALPSEILGSSDDLIDAQRSVWGMARGSIAFITCAFAIAVTLYLDEWLFSAKAATFYGSLPLRRRTVFATAYAAGLLPMIAVEAVVALVVLALSSMAEGVTGAMVLEWFVTTVGCSFVFFSMAQLVCQLTGSRAVGAFLFVLLNVLSVCIEFAIKMIVSALQYGVTFGDAFALDWASPFFGIMANCLWASHYVTGAGVGTDLAVLGGYCLFGVVCTIAAVWLNDKRDLEVAGNAVAYGVLRPILKYLAGICAALLLGAILYVFFWMDLGREMTVDLAGAVALAIAMALGAFLGVLFAQMTLAKSTRVLGSMWKGGLVLACAGALFVGILYADPLATQDKLPDAGNIEKAELLCYGMKVADLTSDEGIESVRTLHGTILENQDEFRANSKFASAQYLESGEYGGTTVGICYTMKDGSIFERSYPIYFERPDTEVEGLEGLAGTAAYKVLSQADDITNGTEGRLSRLAPATEAPEDCQIVITMYESSDNGPGFTLTSAQVKDFLQNAVVPDVLGEELADGVDPVGSYDWLESAIGVVTMDSPTELDTAVDVYGKDGESILYYQLDTERTPHTVAWVRNNLPKVKLVPVA